MGLGMQWPCMFSSDEIKCFLLSKRRRKKNGEKKGKEGVGYLLRVVEARVQSPVTFFVGTQMVEMR